MGGYGGSRAIETVARCVTGPSNAPMIGTSVPSTYVTVTATTDPDTTVSTRIGKPTARWAAAAAAPVGLAETLAALAPSRAASSTANSLRIATAIWVSPRMTMTTSGSATANSTVACPWSERGSGDGRGASRAPGIRPGRSPSR